MNERGFSKTSLIVSIIIIIAAVAITLGTINYFTNVDKEKDDNYLPSINDIAGENTIVVTTESKNKLDKSITGKYIVVPNKDLIYNEGLGRTLDDLYIELYNNNQYTIYDSFGISYFGTFTVEDNNITLNVIKWFSENR